MNTKLLDIAVEDLGSHYLFKSGLDSTHSYNLMTIRWYAPCSVTYPKWSSIFRIFSVELWLILIISIVFAAITTKILGRYSSTSEWQGYKTLASSLTKVWTVILGVPVSMMPRTSSLRSLFLAWVCFSLVFSTVFQAFLTMFLINSGYKTPIQSTMSCSTEVLSLPTHLNTVTFSSMVMKQRHQMYKEILRIVHRMRFVWNGQSITRMCQFWCPIWLLKIITLVVTLSVRTLNSCCEG